MSHEDFQTPPQGEENAAQAACKETLPETVEEAETGKFYSIPYSYDLAKRVASLYAQGQSLQAIARLPGMPRYSTLLRWAKDHAEFAPLLRSIRDIRALHFEDAAIAAAEEAEGKDRDRLRFEAYKWAAEVNDPLTYGKKVAHSGEVKGGTIIQVVTGFGEPNAWQTPPKLNADGTIQKDPPLEIQVEVADGVPREPPEGAESAPTVEADSGGGCPPEVSGGDGSPEESGSAPEA